MKLEDLRSNMVVATNVNGLIYKGKFIKLSDKTSPDGSILIEVKLKVPLNRKKEYAPYSDGDMVLIKLAKCMAVVQND